MPRRALRPCAAPNCGALVERGYCKKHAHREQAFELWRGSPTDRGYDADWRKLRKEFLAEPENRICADCRQAETRHVHHKKKVQQFPELRLDITNLRGLCQRCHNRRTGRGE